ncbi:MAG: YfhO family protein [Chloroflexi bacterium]|nr:YfhO family protein [Chloroflexota bacterium]
MSRSLLALAAIVCVYNLPRLLTGTVQLDGLDVHYSAQRYLSDELHAGRLPFWTPYIFSGFPFLADLQVGAWYPLNWPFFLIGITPRSIAGELLVSGVVACSGTYVLTRRLVPASETAAVGAAMFYGLSGWFAAHSEHVGMVASAAWLPWLLVCVLRFADAPRPRRLVELGLVGAAIALPGSFQIALYTFSFVGIWAACESIAERSWSLLRRLGLGLVAAAAWGGLLSAVMILPALELVSQSVRADLRAVDLPDIGYFHTSALLTLVDPNYYGLLAGQYWGPGDSTQHYFYAGILLVPLVVVGAGQRRVLRTAAALGVPFVWYALGPRGGLFEVVGRLPGFRSVELPMHGWYLPALGLALLAGAGLCGVTRRFGEPWGVALIALVLVDLTIVNQLLNPLAYARPTFEALYGETLQAFDAQVAAADPPVERVYGPPLAAVAYRNHALQSRVSTTYGYNPLELVNYAAYAEAADTDNPRLIEAFGANYALDQGEVRPMANALPFAYFARQAVAVPDDAGARTALADLDPATTTLVTGEVPPPTVGDPSATITVLQVDADRLRFQYSSTTASLLRVAIAVYPGWQATLDGRPLTLVPADAAFLGIELPPGSGEVSLTYSPRLFWPGALLSLLALLAAVVVYQKARGPSSA